jgi:transaldolase/glucose-6-phosphate isomerase
VAIATDKDDVDGRAVAALEEAGHPVMRLSTRLDAIGAEFFRWEFATAVAGAALGINPFDEPNVSEAKEKTKALLASLDASGRLAGRAATSSSDSVEVFSQRFTGGSPGEVVRAALATLAPPDYVAFLSYLPPGSEIAQAVAEIRGGLRTRYHVASTFGVGPRYLHSTGQYHKGGPNSALAFVLTADDESETPIPEVGYSFATLKRAQALGDTETLEAHDRRTVRIQIKDAAHAAEALARLFAEALR